jgi:hypothetical protein
MTIASQFLLCALACAAASVHAAETGCAAPVFPVYSASEECAHRVDAQVREWRLCINAYRARPEETGLLRADREVEARLEKWLVSTRANAGADPERQRLLNRIDRERRLYLEEQEASGRIVYAAERK